MRIEQAFQVPASPADAYVLLIDLEQVAPCIPGAEVGPRSQDGSHPASIAIKVGPMRMDYRGTVRIDSADETAGRAVLLADVRDRRGQGTAKATMTMAVAEAAAGARVETVTEVRLTGRAAQMGRGIVDDVAARLVAEMAGCLAARLAPAASTTGEATGSQEPGSDAGALPGHDAAKPIGGLRLLARVLWARLRRAFRVREGETDA